ncbi:hypothetical protein F511_25318 [Dorcoceras hygrometricum]|uniref:Uncharacterized protein n=1 Tax=Dorcoceras hygrometricum TaxID=472368 RepID=A0A2Z7CWU3_9LAMI|nr:hypothetical protein F511_25318 [Dorcoceras hygrometricum]
MLRAAQGRALGRALVRDKRGSASPMAAHGSAPSSSVSCNQCAKGQQPVGQRAQPAASNDRPTRNNLRGHRALRRAKQRPAMAQQLLNTTSHRALSVLHPAAQQLERSSAQPPGRDARQARIACAYVRGVGIQLAVGPQPLWLRNHNSGLAHRIMVKRLATSPHDPLGITDSACKNHLVVLITLLATRAWLRPVSRGNRHFTVGGGRLSQSGTRPETVSLRSSCTRRLMDFITNGFSSKSWPEQVRRSKAAAARGT